MHRFSPKRIAPAPKTPYPRREVIETVPTNVVVPTQAVLVTPKPLIKVSVYAGAYLVEVHGLTTADIYRWVDERVIASDKQIKIRLNKIRYIPYTLYMGCKPISRRPLPLSVYGKSHMILRVEWHTMLGGAQTPTPLDYSTAGPAMYVQATDELFTGLSDIFAGIDEAKYGDVLNLVEDVLLSSYQLTRAHNKMDMIAACLVFIKSRTQKSLFRSVVVDLYAFVNSIFDAPEMQASDEWASITGVNSFREFIAKWDEIKDSVLAQKYSKLINYLIHYGVIQKVGIKVSKETMKFCSRDISGPFGGANFVHCVVDTVSYTVQRALMFAKTGEWSVFLHGPKSYTAWFDKCMKLKIDSIAISNLEAHGSSYFEFVSTLKQTIEEGQSIVRFGVKSDGSELLSIKRMLHELLLIESSIITKKASQQERQAPLGLLIYGPSSNAKSMFTRMLYQYYGKLMNLPTSSEYMYARNGVEKHWNNFDTHAWCLRMDDIAALHASKASEDLSLMELIMVLNNVPFSPEQASLEAKGKTPFRGKLVLATSNTKHLNAAAYFSCPLAIQRRLPFVITVTARKEFQRMDAPGQVDPHKIPVVTDEWPDIWDVLVEKVVPAGLSGEREMACHEEIASFHNTNDFLDWFKAIILANEKIQAKAMLDDVQMESFKLCQECNRLKCECENFAMQAGTCHLLPQDVSWGEGFTTTCKKVGGWVTHDYTYNSVSNSYICQRTVTDFHGRRLDSLAFGVNVITEHIAKEDIPEHVYADVLDEILKVARQKTVISRSERFVHWVTAKVIRLYVCNARFKAVADYLMQVDLLRRIVRRLADSYVAERGLCKVTVEFLGNLAQKSYANRRWLTYLLQISSLGMIVWGLSKVFTSSKPAEIVEVEQDEGSEDNLEPQGIRISVPNNFFKKSEHENVWKRDDYQTTAFDVASISGNYATLPLDDVARKIQRNCARVEVVGSQSLVPGNAFCVAGHLWMTNNHLIGDEDEYIVKFMVEPETDGVTRNTQMRIRQHEFFRVPEKDLVFFECLAWEVKSDLTSLFAKESFNGTLRAYYMGLERTTRPRCMPVSAVHKTFFPCEHLNREFDYWTGSVPVDTINGDCGSVLVAHKPNTVILGIHQLGGKQNRVFAVETTYEDVQAAITHFDRPIIQRGVPEMSAPSRKKTLGSLSQRAPIRWITEGSLAVYGSIEEFKVKQRSRVDHTLLGEKILEERDWELDVGKPDLGDWRPWNHAYTDIVQQDHGAIDSAILKQAVEGFTADIIAGLKQEDLDSLQVLTEDAAINGIDGVRFVDKMNFNSSMGEPYNQSKKFWVENSGEGLRKKFKPEVKARSENIRRKYARGERACPIFSGQLKDEVRACKKLLEGKVRVFTGAPADWSVVVREQLLPFVKVIQENPFLFEASPGCVVQSLEWEEYYAYLTIHGLDQLVAGDYGKYDKKMSPQMILAAFRVLINILRHAGWTEDQLITIWCIAEDVAYPVVNMNGDLVMFFGSNPSGHPLTVIINCIVNALYMRYAYAVLNPLSECLTFKEFVNLLTYGDDNAMGVSKLAPWFNHTAISNVMASMSVEYTMADKESASVPYISIDQVAYLKRTWRWDEDVGARLAPLDEASIKKMLCFCVKSKTISSEAHMAAVMSSALNEWFFYGKTKFEEERKWIIKLATDAEILEELYFVGAPTWETLKDRFWKSSSHIVAKRSGVQDSSSA